MATCVVVMMPNARRESVKVTPNTSILQVLEVACSRQKLDPQDFELIYQRKRLDLSLSVRFANLSNNVLLEMRPSQSLRSESQITVGLQTENGERLLREFPSTTSLWDILSHWVCERGENSLRGESSHDAEAVCLYMRREVVGEDALKQTTLRSLGLTGGKVVIRLFYRIPDVLKTQAHVESLKIPQSTENCTPEVRTSIKELIEPAQLCAVAPTIETSSLIQPEISPDIVSNTCTNNNVPITNDAESVQDVEMLDCQVETRCNSVPEKTLNAFTEASEENCGSSHVSGSDCNPEVEGEVEVIYVGDRDAVLYDTQASSSQVTESLPDDFFDLTVEDARYLYITLQKQRKEVEDQTLTTNSYKMAKKLEKMLRFKYTILRIQFPDQLVLQAKFTPVEKVSCVEKFVRQFLIDDSMDFYLFTTPPKTMLPTDLALFEAELVPASVIHFGCQHPTSAPILRPEILALMSTHKAACQAATNIRATSRFGVGNSIEVTCPSEPVLSTQSVSVPVQRVPPSSARVEETSPSNPTKVPRWFQMGPK